MMDPDASEDRTIDVLLPAGIWRIFEQEATDLGLQWTDYVRLCALSGLAYQCTRNGEPAKAERVSGYAVRLAVLLGGQAIVPPGERAKGGSNGHDHGRS